MRCTPRKPPLAIWWRRKKPTTSSPSKIISPPSSKTSPTCTWNRFPPQHETVEKGHGRLEVRRIWTSTELNDYLQFPYVAQVFVIQRETTNLMTGECRTETAYGLTSLSREKASPFRFLALNPCHWLIE